MELENTKLVQASGCVILKEGSKSYIMQQPARWTITAKFIFAILALIFTALGVVQIFMFMTKGNGIFEMGLIFLGIGGILSFLLWLIIKKRKEITKLPKEKLKCLCIIDLQNQNLLNCDESIIAPLNKVELSKRFQVPSSTPSLVIKHPKGTILIAKGNPFAGGIKPLTKALKSFGI